MSDMKFYRVNGDELSLRFTEAGVLSSAFLTVEGARYDVAKQLVGCAQEFVCSYTRPLGFRESWTDQEREFASKLSEHFKPNGWLVESVTVRMDGNVEFMLVETAGRNCASSRLVARVVLEPGQKVNYLVAFAGSSEIAEHIESVVRKAFSLV